jgi:Zn-dependent peptidase ImmA (M78 family)
MREAPSRSRYDAISARAQEVLAACQVEAPPVPVKAVAEAQGLRLAFVSFGRLRQSLPGFLDVSAATLFINSEDSLWQQASTMAYELGHWMLHRPLFQENPGRYILRLRGGAPANALQQEAAVFAGCLLAPAAFLRPVKDLAPPAELARLFLISTPLLENRLRHV